MPEPELAVRAYGVRTSPHAEIITGGGNLGPKPANLRGTEELQALEQRLSGDCTLSINEQLE